MISHLLELWLDLTNIFPSLTQPLTQPTLSPSYFPAPTVVLAVGLLPIPPLSVFVPKSGDRQNWQG